MRMSFVMAAQKPEWPEAGDLVIATVQSVTDFGAYANLDEYNKRGLLHVSEISSSWIRNIHVFVREGQKVVLKVLRVDPEKRHIDLSLRRVTKREKIEKMMAWKKERKAETLLRSVAEKTGMSADEVYEKAGALVERECGLYEGFERAAKGDIAFLTEIGVPEKLATAFAEVARERIRVSMVSVKGVVELRCAKPDGVKVIKEAFLNARKAEKSKEGKFRFYVVAAPKYCVEAMAEDYKTAEDLLQKVAQSIIASVDKSGGQGSFRREK